MATLVVSQGANAQTYFDVLHIVPKGSKVEGDYLLGGGLHFARDGNLYGTTSLGGAGFFGTVFRMTPAGTVTVLHAFSGGADGNFPSNALIQGSDGNFYGTTFFGGAAGLGTVFRMTPAGAVTILHAFAGGPTDGAYPGTALVEGRDGNFYGGTRAGGGFLAGIIFRISPDGAFALLHSFDSAYDGYWPYRLIQASDGDFYGSTRGAGDPSTGPLGTIFKITPDGGFSLLHAFTDASLGTPQGPLTQGADGAFYGTIQLTRDSHCGGVYRMAKDGEPTLVHTFSPSDPAGCAPVSSLVQGQSGNLYGVTTTSVYEMTTGGSVTPLHAISVPGIAAEPSLAQGPDGSLYGFTANPRTDRGQIFRLGWTPILNRSFAADFDGDGRSDLVVFRPATAEWLISHSSTNYATWSVFQWGAPNDVPLVADFDGDRKADLVVFRPSTAQWFISYSSTGYATWSVFQWGAWNDVPLAADFDGDGKTDFAVWRPSTAEWFVLYSSSHYSSWTSFQWGIAGDIPLVADFDGDGRTDLVVYRPSSATWYVRTSSSRYMTWTSYQWGAVGDVPLVGDFDGDGKTDLTIWRPSTGAWLVRFSSSGYARSTSYAWGLPGDTPIQADFDGDHRTDLAVWRPFHGRWYVRLSSRAYSYASWLLYHWGVTTDMPL